MTWLPGFRPSLALLFTLTAATTAHARSRTSDIDERDTVVLRGNVHPEARGANALGSAPLDMPMERMILTLALRPGAQSALDELLAAQQDPASPDYRRWLSPEEFGARFGASDEDVRRVVEWLERRGFGVDDVARGRTWIDFTGTVSDVERAFGTRILEYEVNGRLHRANAVDPSIPRALAGLVSGIVSLHDFGRQRQSHGFRRVADAELTPEYTSSGGGHYLSPADFAKIYNVGPVHASGLTGAGRSVAIVGRTDIAIGDVQYFRSLFALPSNDPSIIHNGTAPGNLGGGEEVEALLDVEWGGAVAKSAAVKFVVSRSTFSTDGVDLSAQYIVNHDLADTMSTSFGACEQQMGSSENAFYANLWAQAAAQGITSFVASGDSGAAGCEIGNASIGSGHGVNGLSTTPYNVCVGGTQLNETGGTYWSAANGTGLVSALSYIPERAWNESGSAGGSGLWSTGGGASTIHAKPSWQVSPGVPADGKRDVPDVSLSGASHDAYLVIQGHTSLVSGLGAVGGTSASSPALASLMALVAQKTGGRLGNANVRFYQLGQAQYASHSVAVFHDTTAGSNTVPGVAGFSCGTGYDQATGLGSVDAAALVASWSASAQHGDANGDGAVDISDVFYLINMIFAGGPGPVAPSDANGDGKVDISDVFYLINFIYAGGPAPV